MRENEQSTTKATPKIKYISLGKAKITSSEKNGITPREKGDGFTTKKSEIPLQEKANSFTAEHKDDTARIARIEYISTKKTVKDRAKNTEYISSKETKNTSFAKGNVSEHTKKADDAYIKPETGISDEPKINTSVKSQDTSSFKSYIEKKADKIRRLREHKQRLAAENREFEKEQKVRRHREIRESRIERRTERKNRSKAKPVEAKKNVFLSIASIPKRTISGIRSIPQRIKKLLHTPKLLRKTVTVLLLSLWALIVLFPFYWMILTSFKSYGSYNQETIPQFIVKNPTLENYVTAFTSVPLARYFLNTLAFTLVTTLIMLVVTVLASYGFARINFKGKDLVFTLFLSMMMIPAELVIITNYVTITDLDMRNTLMGLVLPSVTSVFYIYLLKENFQQVPDELYYAAKVDGTTDFFYMLKVMIPICRPTVVTVTILKIIECWNSYVWPRLVTDEENYYLVSVGIQAIREGGFGRENIPAMMAAVTVISVPLILLFLIFRNKIMAGVARGGTKG